jgi:hypothetical protein
MATAVGLLIVLLALQDSFEAMVLPRRVMRRWRAARIYFRNTWRLWRRACSFIPAGKYRENGLSLFGPLSLLGLFVSWVFALITGFALMHWGQQTLPGDAGSDFRLYLYHSGETFFTLGYGDVTPATYTGKMLSVAEAGIGFGFMAIIIGYLPVLYQAFSRREQSIALLDARAGSPPTASELLRRWGQPEVSGEMERFLAEWEVWAADLLESHLSFPVIGFYRSQHDNQSWLAALATMLDASAVLLVTRSGPCRRRAELTFAMARHACVDLCLVFRLPPVEPPRERLTAAELHAILTDGLGKGASLDDLTVRLGEMRALYEPFLQALSEYFCLKLPRFAPERAVPDNWQTSPWTKRAPGITELTADGGGTGEHFG